MSIPLPVDKTLLSITCKCHLIIRETRTAAQKSPCPWRTGQAPTSPDLSTIRLQCQWTRHISTLPNKYLYKGLLQYWHWIIKHSTMYKCLRSYLRSSIPRFKTLHLPALERARSSLCLVLKASALREAFLDPPTLIGDGFKSTLNVKKSQETTCSQQAFALPQHIFQTPSAVATATPGVTSRVSRLAAGPQVSKRRGMAERNGGSLLFIHIAQTVKTTVQMGKERKAVELKGLLRYCGFAHLKLNKKSKDYSLHYLTHL